MRSRKKDKYMVKNIMKSTYHKLREKLIYDNGHGRGRIPWFELFDTEIFIRMDRRRQRIIFNWLRFHYSGGVNLIPGCGTGSDLALLKILSNKIIGLDISERAIKVARSLHGDIDLIIADAECLPLRKCSIEMVFCKSIIHHLPMWGVQFLSEVNRCLK